MKGVQVVNAIRHFALQRGILKNISAFANLKHIRVSNYTLFISIAVSLKIYNFYIFKKKKTKRF